MLYSLSASPARSASASDHSSLVLTDANTNTEQCGANDEGRGKLETSADISIIRIHSPARMESRPSTSPSSRSSSSRNRINEAMDEEATHPSIPSLLPSRDNSNTSPQFNSNTRESCENGLDRTWRRRKQQGRRYFDNAKQGLTAASTNYKVQSDTKDDLDSISYISRSVNGASPKLMSFSEVSIATIETDRRNLNLPSKQSSRSISSTSRWYKQKRYMLPLLCISCIIVSFLIALIILYPSSPSITTNKVILSQLAWKVESSQSGLASNGIDSSNNSVDGIGGITANLTLSVEISIRNNNRFGAHFSPGSIGIAMAHPNTSYFFSLSPPPRPSTTLLSPPSSTPTIPPIDPNTVLNQQIATMNQQLEEVSLAGNQNANIPIEMVGEMSMPGGYIAARDEISLSLSTSLCNLHLDSSLELIQLSNHLKVFASSDTSGKVSFMGISIPYKVSTECSAMCSIDLWSLNVNIQEQQCSSHSST